MQRPVTSTNDESRNVRQIWLDKQVSTDYYIFECNKKITKSEPIAILCKNVLIKINISINKLKCKQKWSSYEYCIDGIVLNLDLSRRKNLWTFGIFKDMINKKKHLVKELSTPVLVERSTDVNPTLEF